ncbi:MAG: hypothetical protein ACTXOO_01050 [Sodalis sp. (in: enterobacteria)]
MSLLTIQVNQVNRPQCETKDIELVILHVGTGTINICNTLSLHIQSNLNMLLIAEDL